MAKNKDGHRTGAINNRYQEQLSDGTWVKYDDNDKLRGAKQGEPFKNVRKK
jgi:hypothetical protein